MQAAAESYIGLVEVGVGLIPAGGGTKEMLLRLGPEKAFETIGFAQDVDLGAGCAPVGVPAETSMAWTMNRDRLVFDAKQLALKRAQEGYRPPVDRRTFPSGEMPFERRSISACISHGAQGAFPITTLSIGRKLSWILAGGALPHAGKVSEDRLLDLEREAFLSLCGEPKTLERIQYTLKTGKTLRN